MLLLTRTQHQMKASQNEGKLEEVLKKLQKKLDIFLS
jgi:hypothetical protein